jgi:hypothetical protein
LNNLEYFDSQAEVQQCNLYKSDHTSHIFSICFRNFWYIRLSLEMTSVFVQLPEGDLELSPAGGEDGEQEDVV